LIGLVAAFAGGIRVMRITQAIRRYQVFTLIGIANVASALLMNLGAVLRTSVEGSPIEIVQAVWKLLTGFLIGG
jgi:hypothetical protein